MFKFCIDRGGTFTDVYAELPDGGVRTLKLLSEDPSNYPDAPREGIRRVMEEWKKEQSGGKGEEHYPRNKPLPTEESIIIYILRGKGGKGEYYPRDKLLSMEESIFLFKL